jgi:hypothetical protein
MKSRFAFVALVALAALLGTSTAAFATSALSTSTNASAAQYGVAGSGESVQNTLAGTQGSGVSNDAGNQGSGVASAVQAPRQLAAGSGSDAARLPFTGMALIPILLIGLALLGGGFVMRRRSGDGVGGPI